jgi:hypothetical protein
MSDLATQIATWLPVAAILLSSVATALTKYPKAEGWVAGIQKVLDVLSFLTHRDSPGTLQLPLVQRSAPPKGKGR